MKNIIEKIKKNKKEKEEKKFETSFILGLIFLFHAFVKTLIYFTGRVFFDEGVYIGIAKYFASFGNAGYFESIRPLLLPLIITPLQFIKVNSLISGRILSLFLDFLCIYIIYRISKSYFNKKSALWSAFLFSISSMILYYGGYILNDVITFTLVTLCCHLIFKKKYFLSGIILGISFLFKFPVLIAGIPILIIMITRTIKNKSILKNLIFPGILFGTGIILISSTYFIFNIAFYDGPIIERITIPLLDASQILQNDTWLYDSPNVGKYILFLIFGEFPIFFSFIMALKYQLIKILQINKFNINNKIKNKIDKKIIKNSYNNSNKINKEIKKEKKIDKKNNINKENIFLKILNIKLNEINSMTIFFSLCALFFLLYFALSIARFDSRYMISVIPFLSIIGGKWISKNKIKTIIKIIFVIIISLSSLYISSYSGFFETNIHIPKTNLTTISNSGFATINAFGPVIIMPGPNLYYMYNSWYKNNLADILIISIDDYPCIPSDTYCNNDRTLKINKIIATHEKIFCGILYGENMIVLQKNKININDILYESINKTQEKKKEEFNISKIIECKNNLDLNLFFSKPIAKDNTTRNDVFIRISDFEIDKNGNINNLEELKKIIEEIKLNNTSGNTTVGIIFQINENNLNEKTSDFISKLNENIFFGIIDKNENNNTLKNKTIENFIEKFNKKTTKNITIIMPESDDFINNEQKKFSDKIKYSTIGSWDNSFQNIPAKKIELYTIKEWNNFTIHDIEYLKNEFNIISKIDYEVGIDIPSNALYEEQMDTIIEFIQYINEK